MSETEQKIIKFKVTLSTLFPSSVAMSNRSTGLNNSNRDPRMSSSSASPASRAPGGRRLSTPLATEVRSPGFASRLTSYIRDSHQLDPPRRDASAPPAGSRNRYPVVQPRYSGIGLFPKVILNRPPLPRLTPTRRRSCGLSNVTVKVAQVSNMQSSLDFVPKMASDEETVKMKSHLIQLVSRAHSV